MEMSALDTKGMFHQHLSSHLVALVGVCFSLQVSVFGVHSVICSRTPRVFPAAQSRSQLIIAGLDKNTAPCYYKRMHVS